MGYPVIDFVFGLRIVTQLKSCIGYCFEQLYVCVYVCVRLPTLGTML